MPADLFPAEPLITLAAYERDSGMSGPTRVRDEAPGAVVDLIGQAGIRGRGGAGFPVARKWAGVRAATDLDDDCFVVVNAAEGEPGTFKDRALIRSNPFLVLEGALVAAHCVGAHRIDAMTFLRVHLARVTDSFRWYPPTQEQVLVATLLDRFPDDLAVRLAGVPRGRRGVAAAHRRPPRRSRRAGVGAAVRATRLDHP